MTNTRQRTWHKKPSCAPGGHYLVYNRKLGLVLAIIDGDFVPIDGNPPGWPTPVRIAVEALEQGVAGSNPLVE